MEDLSFAVKYPFTNQAKSALSNAASLSLDSKIIEKALTRIRNALKGNYSKSSAIHPDEQLEDIAGYACSRMILATMKNNFLNNKFAVAEAKRAYAYLNYEKDSKISELLEQFNFKIKKKSDDSYLVHFSTYLKHTPGSLDYRLMNRNLSNGYVETNNHERLRLLQEAIKEKVLQLPYFKNPPSNIKDAAKELLEELPKITTSKISFKKGDNPPCIESLLISLKKHQNLNHQARWYLVVYLLFKKMDSEKIVELFTNFPDFNEKISRYQVEHAKKQAYMVPSCSTIRGYGLCVANCRMKNPVQWNSKKHSRVNENKEEEKKDG